MDSDVTTDVTTDATTDATTETFETNNYTDSEKLVFNKEAKVKIYTLYQLCKIIDLAMKRGAFRANEASLIGLFYDIIYKSIKEAFEKYSTNTEGVKRSSIIES